MKKIAILGSTGSIGTSTLDVIKNFPELFEVGFLTVNSRTDDLEKQLKEFKPGAVVIKDKEAGEAFKLSTEFKGIILTGEEGLLEATRTFDYDILLSALVGFAGLAPTIEAIKRGKRIALANKETLVAAGEIVVDLADKHNSEIIPVDSEHSAIFQCLIGEKTEYISKIILTASGGPFLNTAYEKLKVVTVKEALNHPNWSMGAKITIDSASMMNKGLEVIEAHWLFGLNKERIQVLVHPQSIIHSMIEFIDGSIKAQLSMPDMKLPIQYALSYPERLNKSYTDTNFSSIKNLTFFEPDFKKFECLKLAFDVMEQGGTAPCILNAANEIAVEMFLEGKINFLQIPDVIKSALDMVENYSSPELESIIECDRLTRKLLKKEMN